MTLIRIGSRGSKLALAQANIVQKKIQALYPEAKVTIIVISTSGDINQTDSLSLIGGKGVFAKEIQTALLENTIDIAVHSMKDLTSRPPDNLRLSGFLKSESTADVLISKNRQTLAELPPHAIIATGSMRRRALIRRLRPDIQFVDIRGNIDTRLEKLKTSPIDAIILSEAGLIRLNLQNHIHDRLPPQFFLPAPGQGVIAMETRALDVNSDILCQQLSDPIQNQISKLEYEVLKSLDFNCTIPLGMHTELVENHIKIKIGIEKYPQLWKEWTADYPVRTAHQQLQGLIHDIRQFLSSK